jgi:hypothetical protein
MNLEYIYICPRIFVCPESDDIVSGCPLKEADRNLVYENKVLGVPRYVRKNFL